MTTINDCDNVMELAERTHRTLRQLFRTKLLHRREELAEAAAEHAAHGLPGADLLWDGVRAVEQHLRMSFPEFWETHFPDWVAADAARLHSAEGPSLSDCSLCVRRVAPATSPPPAS